MEYLKARIYIYISLVCLTLLGFVDHPAYQGACNMAIEFDGSSGLITFPAAAPINDLDDKTIIVVFNADSAGEGSAGRFTDKSGGGTGWLFYYHVSNALGYNHFDDDGVVPVGSWRSASSSISTGSILHGAITYDRTSIANDPVFYVNGSSSATTELITPVGNMDDDNANDLIVGNQASDASTFDGIFYKILIYNRILSASEIADDYNSRQFISTFNGLVWACQFAGASGLQTYEGTSIGATNLFTDFINGSKGTPANTPIGRGDIWLHNGHLQWQEGRGGS
jgi:hypothetical protein